MRFAVLDNIVQRLQTIGTKLIAGFLVIVVIFGMVSLYQIDTAQDLSVLQRDGEQRREAMLALRVVMFRVNEVYVVLANGMMGGQYAAAKNRFEEIRRSSAADIATVRKLAASRQEEAWANTFAEQYVLFLELFETKVLPLIRESEVARNRYSDALIISNAARHLDEIHMIMQAALLAKQPPSFVFRGTTSYDSSLGGFQRARSVAQNDIEGLRKIMTPAESVWVEAFSLHYMQYLKRIEADILPGLMKLPADERGRMQLQVRYAHIAPERAAAIEPLEQMIASLQWDGFRASQNIVAMQAMEQKLAVLRQEIMTALQGIHRGLERAHGDMDRHIALTRTQTSSFAVVISIIGSIAALVIALLITRSITRPLGSIVKVANGIAHGTVNQEIIVTRSDEVGALADAFRGMQNAIQHVLAETQMLIGAVQHGLLDRRGNAEAFDGSWRELVQGLNNLTDIFARMHRDVQDAKASLEHKVVQRTMDLARSNRELLAEIEERSRAEAALRTSEEQYRTLVDNVNVGVYRSTPAQGQYIQANPAMARMFGYDSVEEFQKVVVTSLYPSPYDRYAFVEDLHAHGYVKNRELTMRRKDGTDIWCSTNATAKFDESGDLVWIDGILEDITERKRLEEQLHQSQKMEAIGTLAGGVAHDFNNILTAIMGYGDLIRMRIDANSPVRGYIDEVLSAAERAAVLTQSLLAFSRKQSISPRPIDLNNVVKRFDRLLRRVIGEDIDFRTMLAPEVLTVMADSGQLEQVLMNLATNARDAMPEGGIFTMKTERVEYADAVPGSYLTLKPGAYAVISVTDSGYGMDEGTVQRIFDPFFTTKEPGKGTGLGLSIVYGIIKQHGGEIAVSSEPQRGTTFTIYLPLTRELCIQEYDISALPPVGGDETVLIAEDDGVVRDYMRNVLEGYGYTVLSAVDGEDAVLQYRKHQEDISLLILDVVMPKKNGREAFNAICELDNAKPVIFSSGYAADLLIKKGALREGSLFLSKPVPPRLLLEKVREALA